MVFGSRDPKSDPGSTAAASEARKKIWEHLIWLSAQSTLNNINTPAVVTGEEVSPRISNHRFHSTPVPTAWGHPGCLMDMLSTWTILSGCPGWTTLHYHPGSPGHPSRSGMVLVINEPSSTSQPFLPVVRALRNAVHGSPFTSGTRPTRDRPRYLHCHWVVVVSPRTVDVRRSTESKSSHSSHAQVGRMS